MKQRVEELEPGEQRLSKAIAKIILAARTWNAATPGAIRDAALSACVEQHCTPDLVDIVMYFADDIANSEAQ